MDTIGKDLLTVEATVKWFNQFKGYGFVTVSSVSSDVFLHFSTLEKAHLDHLNNGDTVSCKIQKTDRGYQVISIDKVLKCIKYATEDSKTMEVTGQTKWFNPLKGFGFAQLPSGEDVFIHSSLLLKSGLKGLEPNIPVRLTVRKTNFGYEAINVQRAK